MRVIAKLEHFHKCCSGVLLIRRTAVFLFFWLRFGSVTGFFKPAPSPKPRQKTKILAAHALHHLCQRSSFNRKERRERKESFSPTILWPHNFHNCRNDSI